ncbi:MAG: SDR family oxidoreductase [Cyanobacteriota bacterium]|nr:SDR family oxidoreductase [Cyanobacteriota bacterium]
MTTIVLTGSQSGMGWVMRQHLESQPGTRIIGVDLPGKGAEVEADLSSSAGCQAAVDQVLLQAGDGLSGVVANAGVDANDPALTFGVNYFGVVDFLQGLQPALAQAAPTSVVVNVSNSIAITPHIPLAPVEALLAGDRGAAMALMAGQTRFSYQVSKFAIARWIRRQAATEPWAGAGIRINGVCPGPVMTPLLEHDLQDPVKGPAIMSLPRPLGEFTTCEQVAHLVEFLLSDRARFIVGQLIMIDGGIETTFRAQDHPSVWTVAPQGDQV